MFEFATLVLIVVVIVIVALIINACKKTNDANTHTGTNDANAHTGTNDANACKKPGVVYKCTCTNDASIYKDPDAIDTHADADTDADYVYVKSPPWTAVNGWKIPRSKLPEYRKWYHDNYYEWVHD